MASRKKKIRELQLRRRSYAENPLEFTGETVTQRMVPPRAAWLGVALRPLVDLVPAVKPTQSGRSHEKQIRAIVMIFGLAIAVWGGEMSTALLGCVIAMLAQFIPVQQTTRLRWQRKTEAMQKERTVTERQPATIHFDGETVLVRVGGQRVRSVDVSDEETVSVRLRKAGKQLALGIVPRGKGRTDALWILTDPPAERPPRLDPGKLLAVDLRKLQSPIEANYADFVVLHDAVCGSAEAISVSDTED